MKLLPKSPFVANFLGKYLVFRKEDKPKQVYLTFDDGPISEFTPWILDTLAKEEVRATFFLVGENMSRNPELVRRILNEGHAIGNHTQHHLNGFRTPLKSYLNDVRDCENEIRKYVPEGYPKLFRPPYGKITPAKIQALRREGYSIVYWDVLSKDYIPTLGAQRVLQLVDSKTKPGSIIVMHDNKKAISNVKGSLGLIIKKLKAKGYEFGLLTD